MFVVVTAVTSVKSRQLHARASGKWLRERPALGEPREQLWGRASRSPGTTAPYALFSGRSTGPCSMMGKEKRVEFLLHQALPKPSGPDHEWTHPCALVSL